MTDLAEQIETLQLIIISRATGGSTESETDYTRLRQIILSQPSLEAISPRFLRTCRSLDQFWQFIKSKYPTYAERRTYIWDEFKPLFEYVDTSNSSPADNLVKGAIDKFDSGHVQAAWSKALDRRSSDPEGAITIARTLLESVCKHILDDAEVKYDDSPDISKLYKQTAEILKLAPSQHTEQIFKQILGGCTAVVEGLGALRNRLSDSHGKGKVGVKPAPRHAELAVNLAGALAVYLLATWEARKETLT
jgi:hypothetical protein